MRERDCYEKRGTSMYRQTECPWCGNGITVRIRANKKRLLQTCKWCNRCISTKARYKGGKLVFDVQVADDKIE